LSPQPLDTVKGFGVTFKQIFKKPITQQYPEYKRPVYPRFRGRHRLWRHGNGFEKCVGGSPCAAACPADCIAVVSFSNPFYSALALIGNLASLAVMYLLLSAEFVAAAQVLVYAGAVMVMFLFVIACLGGRADAPWAGGPGWQQVGAVLAAGAILLEGIVVIGLQAGGHLSHEHDVG